VTQSQGRASEPLLKGTSFVTGRVAGVMVKPQPRLNILPQLSHITRVFAANTPAANTPLADRFAVNFVPPHPGHAQPFSVQIPVVALRVVFLPQVSPSVPRSGCGSPFKLQRTQTTRL